MQRFNARGLVFVLVTIVVLLIVIPPVAFLLLASITDVNPGILYVAATPTLSNFVRLFESRVALASILNSLIIALWAAVFSTTIGSYFAWFINKTDSKLAKKLEPFIVVSLVLSPLVQTLAWTALLDPYNGILNVFFHGIFNSNILNIYSIPGIILVDTIAAVPLSYTVMKGYFQSFDSNMEEAAYMAGASKLRTFSSIVLNLARPTILTAFMLTFLVTIEEVSVPLILALPSSIPVASLQIYLYTQEFPPDYGLATSLAVVLFAINLTLYYVGTRAVGNRQWTTVGLRGFRSQPTKLSRGTSYILTIVLLAYLILAMGLPYADMLLRALSVNTGAISYGAFSLSNFVNVFTNSLTMSSITNSLTISAIGAALLTILTFLIAVIGSRSNYPLKRFLSVLAILPFSIAGIVLAVGIYTYFVYALPTFIYATIWAIMLAFMIRFIGHGFRIMTSGTTQIHHGLDEAARISGASWLKSIKDVVLPISSPTLISGYVILFMYCLRELPASLLLYTSRSLVWSVGMVLLWEGGNMTNLVMAFALVQLFLILFVSIFSNVLSKRLSKKYG